MQICERICEIGFPYKSNIQTLTIRNFRLVISYGLPSSWNWMCVEDPFCKSDQIFCSTAEL